MRDHYRITSIPRRYGGCRYGPGVSRWDTCPPDQDMGRAVEGGTACPPRAFLFIPIGNAWMGAHNPQEHAKQTALQYKHRDSTSDTSRIGRKHFREVLYLSAIRKKNHLKWGGFFGFLEITASQTPLSHNFPLL